MSNLKTKWYIWFSYISLAILWMDTARRIKTLRANSLSDNSFIDSFGLWIRACGNMFKIIILYMVIPILLISLLANMAERFFPAMSNSPLATGVGGIVLLLILYLAGVYATYRHLVWREKNMQNLFASPLQKRKNIFVETFKLLFSSKNPIDTQDKCE